MNVSLIAHTNLDTWVAGVAAATCTRADDPGRALNGALASGHESVLEHASFTFMISGVSRALLAQLTRHRIASYSVESQRYCDYNDGFGYVTPPSIKALGPEWEQEYRNQIRMIQGWYDRWQDLLGGNNEDARFILPNACETRLVMTMNARELRHFFALRCCNRAQWEIRELANSMLAICEDTAPVLFKGAGPGCLRGPCPEGRRGCGHPQQKRRISE